MPTPCKRCGGSGIYRRAHFNGFCFACKGRGVIVRRRRPSVRRIEASLVELQNERARLEATTSPLEVSEYDHILLQIEQFFQPILAISNMPSSPMWASATDEGGYVARFNLIKGAIEERSSRIERIAATIVRLKALGPLVGGWRKRLASERDATESEVSALRAFLAAMPRISTVMQRASELQAKRSRIERIRLQTEELRKELASESRTTEAKAERFRARALLTDRENRASVRRIASDIPVTSLCPYCEDPIVDKHLDHIIPVARGGRPLRENLIWVCTKCNLRKHDLTLLEFADKNSHNYMAIVRRLQSLGKRP